VHEQTDFYYRDKGRSKCSGPLVCVPSMFRQLEGESPFDNPMEVIVSRRREIVMLCER
jgi:hypothetical protein